MAVDNSYCVEWSSCNFGHAVCVDAVRMCSGDNTQHFFRTRNPLLSNHSFMNHYVDNLTAGGER